MMDNVNPKHLWYTRRGGVVRGPFPSGQITRYILLGRLAPTDELSHDRTSWVNVEEIPALLPAGMRPDASDVERERLELLRRREDERSGRDRRNEQDPSVAAQYRQRRKGDRRAPESEDLQSYRLAKTRLLEEAADGDRQRFKQLAFPVLILCLLLVGTILYTPPRTDSPLQCDAAPAPGINWSNCALEGAVHEAADLREARLRNANLSGARLTGARFDGADMAYARFSIADLSHATLRRVQLRGASLRNADLSQADLTDADLSYADLTGANLGAVTLRGVKLDNAIWIDGSKCAPGSLGTCKPMS